ncbi:MAG: M48 family metalloprotease [Candidatus Anstonellaceae archaeon]
MFKPLETRQNPFSKPKPVDNFYHRKPMVSELPYENQKKFSKLKDFIEKACLEHGLENPKLVVRKSDFLSCSVKVKPRPFEIMTTSATLDKLSESELKAVLAHEIGHRKLHTSWSLRLGLALTVINHLAITDIFYRGILFAKYLSSHIEYSLLSFGISSALLYAVRCKMYKQEHEADLFAAKVTSKEDAISALSKFHKLNLEYHINILISFIQNSLDGLLKGSAFFLSKTLPARFAFKLAKNTASIVNSAVEYAKEMLNGLGGTFWKCYIKLYEISPYSTHPPIEKRLEKIKEME